MAASTTNATEKYIGVSEIPTDQLTANPHNPRMLFDREPLEVLQSSIDKSGILVPLTVYFDPDLDIWVILDGQRRWMCAQNLEMESVPVNQVAKPSLVENIVTMFQIHKLREDWELMPTALKLEVLMDETKERSERVLSEITGLDRAVVSRCKKLLSYPGEFQETMLDPDPAERIRADFFIELHAVRNDRFVNQLDWYSKSSFTRSMLGKYLHGDPGIKAVTDFRVVKQAINNARKAGFEEEISHRLREFADDIDLPPAHLAIEPADQHATATKILHAVERFRAEIDAIQPSDLYGEVELWEQLRSLADLIDAKLRSAGLRPRA